MADETVHGSVGWYNIWNVLFRRDRDSIARREKERAKEERLRDKDPLYWTRGRLVAIRPDGARKSLDPEKLRLIRTPEEHEDAVATLRIFWDQLQRKVRDQGRDFQPEWATGEAVESRSTRSSQRSSDNLRTQHHRPQIQWPPKPR